MRAALDALYRFAGLAAGFFLIAMACLALAQIVGRMLGYAAHSFDEFAGYCMAASSFLGLAWTLRSNEHIRVTLAVERLRGSARRAMEIVCLVVALAVIGFFAWSAVDMTWTSYKLDDVSTGLVPIKLWIPQSGMALGLVILAVAIADDLVAMTRGATTSYERARVETTNVLPTFDR